MLNGLWAWRAMNVATMNLAAVEVDAGAAGAAAVAADIVAFAC